MTSQNRKYSLEICAIYCIWHHLFKIKGKRIELRTNRQRLAFYLIPTDEIPESRTQQHYLFLDTPMVVANADNK